MYYRVAIQRRGDHLDQLPNWQWTSMVLSSLQTLFQFVRRYGALQYNHLRVFSSSSRQGLEEQLMQENLGLGSPSDTAAHFLQERLIYSPEVMRGTPASEGGAYQQMASIAVINQQLVNERGGGGSALESRGMSALERRREELESGPGGDHDIPYRFTLPISTLQVLAWMKLLARVQNGELHP